MSIKNEIKANIKSILDKLNIEVPDNQINVEVPANKKNGDYATNVALVLARTLKRRPMDIAKEIAPLFDQELFENVFIAEPGFINLVINKQHLLNNINKIIQEGNNYGKSNYGQGKKINIEFVSANPTGILHVGHGRGATYGDNLARILKFAGYDITKEYYVNDAGNQMNNLGISIKERYKEICGMEAHLPEDGYHGKEIIDIAKNIYDCYGNTKLEENIEFFKKEGLDILLAQIKKDLDVYRVNFDIFTSEQSLYDRSLVENVLDKLKKSGKCYIAENALWLKTTDYNDEKDRVLIKSDGNYTYLLPDIAYHVDKLSRGYDELIDVLGSDHHGYINRLKASLEILGQDKDKLDIKILQMVRLIKDGEELKLSKRTGKTITLNDLISEVGVNATRYFFSSHSLDAQMDFDLDLAMKQSSDNPVYYIEYANARISSILKHYPEINSVDKFITINDQQSFDILNKLYEFEDTVLLAAIKKQPHIIANYAYNLATLFHSYYTKEKIITDNMEYTNERILLIKAIKTVLVNSLDLIGIIPREEM